MAVLKLDTFGGMLPSVSPRRLPGTASQLAQNLDLRGGDFRPLRDVGAAELSVPAGTASMFRTPSGQWLYSSAVVHYVNGQINDAATERVYLTGRSGYPEAWQSGAYRRLGVPAPATAPSVVLNVTDEFTTDEKADALDDAIAAIIAAATGLDTSALIGTEPSPLGPTTTTVTVDNGNELAKWTLSTQYNSGADRSLVQTSTAQGNPSPSYVTVRDEGGGTAYAYRDLSLHKADVTEMWSDVIFHHTGVNNSWYQAREATITIQANEFGQGVRIRLMDYDGMRGDPNAAYISIHKATSWAADDTALVATLLPIKLAQLTTYRIKGKLEWNSDGTCLVTARVEHADGTLIGETSCTDTFSRGDYISFANMRGPDANGSVDGLPQGFATYYDNLTVYATQRTNFWLPAGTATDDVPLPASGTGSYALMVQLTSDSAPTPYNEDDRYLLDPLLGGYAVTYLGVRYWAVPVNDFMGNGLSIDEAALKAQLLTLPSPAGGTLLSDADASAIADYIHAIYAGTTSPSRPLVSALKSAQLTLLNLHDAYSVTPTASAKASTFKAAIGDVATASEEVGSFYARIASELKTYVASTYSTTIDALLPEAVTRVVESRAYLVTYITDWGEESAPSPASELLECDANDNIAVTIPAPPAGRYIVGWRLYRSSTVNATTAAWQLVADTTAANAVLAGVDFNYFDIGNLAYTDALTQDELQETCPSLSWAEPPEGLSGLVALPNGIMAGFVGRTLYFCEAYQPHAWPAAYSQPLEHLIVGLGVFGQTLVVLTQGHPYYVSGADPASMSAQKLESTQACVSARSIASMEGGVVYASPDGLCIADAGGVKVLTEGAFTREDWQALQADSAFGCFSEGVYYLFLPAAI